MLHPVRWLPRRRLVLVLALLRRRLMLGLALLNRQRQPGRSMSLVVSRQREAEIPPAEIPTWARLRGSSDCYSVRKQLLCV